MPLLVTTASGKAGWTADLPLSLTTASESSGWIAGSPLLVITASGNAGWTAGSPLSVTTAFGNSGWTSGVPLLVIKAPACTSLCSANCDWEFEDCFSSFVGLVNLVETGFSSRLACTFDGFSTKFGVTL